MNNLTPKQERFTLNLFKGLSQREAYIQAGYSKNNSPNTIDRHAYDLANNDKVLTRFNELRDMTTTEAVMPVIERKERLSEIGRAKLTDFQTAGADGSFIDIGPENKSAGALQEITSRTEYNANGSNPAIITKVKLHDPVRAIDLLNKMDKIYSDGSPVNEDNRVINFILSDNQSRNLIEGIAKRLDNREGSQDATE